MLKNKHVSYMRYIMHLRVKHDMCNYALSGNTGQKESFLCRKRKSFYFAKKIILVQRF